MVPANSWKRPDILSDGFFAFSSKATQALQKIISETSADILLSTSHKATFSIEKWREIFKVRGIDVNGIDKLPENSSCKNRKEEILNWCNPSVLKLENFVVIDDDKSLNGLPNSLKSRLVLTSPLVGLTDELAFDAVNILKELHTLH